MSNVPQVVIVGAGFGGLGVAEELAHVRCSDYVDLNDMGSDVEFSKCYADGPMSDAAVAASAAQYAGFVGVPPRSQLIGATV